MLNINHQYSSLKQQHLFKSNINNQTIYNFKQNTLIKEDNSNEDMYQTLEGLFFKETL